MIRQIEKKYLVHILDLILVMSLLFTCAGKLSILYGLNSFIVTFFTVILPDFQFVLYCSLLFRFVSLFHKSIWIWRLCYFLVFMILLLSITNMLWLIYSGVQLHLDILALFCCDFKDLWPLVMTYLRPNIWLPLSFVLFIVLISIVMIHMVRFNFSVIATSNRYITSDIFKPTILIMIYFIKAHITNYDIGPQASMLSYSCHWNEIVALFFQDKIVSESQNSKKQPQITISPQVNYPNIVIIFLESVSYKEYSNQANCLMPFLNELATQGTEFTKTYATVSHTHKAIWSCLTSTTPAIQPDYVECVPEQPIVSLVSVLKLAGYRSAFFKMAKGTFESPAGFCQNMGYDWAWFRENYGDPQSYLGYLAGDDNKIIEPSFKWIKEGAGPFLLTILTSVTHDPFELPDKANISETKEKYNKYCDTVKYTDDFIRKLYKIFQEQGLADNTIFCIIGDHGTSFRDGIQNNGRWFPYEEVIRIPWLLIWKDHIQSGLKINTTCSQLDVTPTILKLLNIDTDSLSFEGYNAIQSIPERQIFFSSWYPNSPVGYIENNIKYLYLPPLDTVISIDLNTDPEENSSFFSGVQTIDTIKNNIINWEKKNKFHLPPRRYTENVYYEHWRVFSSGNRCWSYYIK